ncbi:MAG: hypothetical protein Unbinned1446contig1005_19 [Prokaryotic dsDNA virus sp.]|nr:MAG: hypothetical protein Unbinned1446contig1005_19 [Prokaryotic dsDNA virus sp.]|tara:strand:+ start:1339 stop:4395 length:3057 start_codon:yes stop_codon:yes gene_type:complete
MLEITVKKQSDTDDIATSWIALDVTDVQLEMSFSRELLDDITAQVGKHSLSFTLPFSPINDKFFQGSNVLDTSATNDFNWLNNTDCIVRDKSIPVLQGTLNLDSVDLQSRTYSCVVYGNEANVFQKLKSKTWTDIFTQADGTVFTGLNHTQSAQTVVDSYNTLNDITNGSVGAGTITYPLIDKGVYSIAQDTVYPYTISNQQSFTGDDVNAQRLLATSQLPAIKVGYLLEQIVDYLNYSPSSEGFLDASATGAYGINKMYMLVAGKDFSLLPVAPMKLQLDTELGYGTSQAIPFNDSSDPFYDPQDYYGQPIGLFFAPYTGTFTFRLSVNVNSTGTGGGIPVFAISPMVNGTIGDWFFLNNDTTFDDYPITVSLEMSVDLLEGDYFAPAFEPLISGAGEFSVLQGSTIELINVVAVNRPVDVIASLGKDTVDKWLKAICTQFNLIVEVNEINKEITFWGRDQFYNDNIETVDWTKKIDTASPFVVQPYTDVLSRTSIYTNAEGNDSLNLYNQRQENQVYGTYKRSTNVDLAAGERVIGNYFVPFRAKRIPQEYVNLVPVYGDSETATATHMRMWADNAMDGNLSDVDNGPMLFFHGGFNATHQQSNLRLWTTNVEEDSVASLYPIAKAVSTTPQNYTLNFKSSSIADAYTSNTQDGLFARFHRVQYNERHSADARIVTCQALLQPEDVAYLRFNEIIFIAGSHYQLVSIDNYAVGVDKLCTLTLRRYLGGAELIDQTAVDGCLLTVSGVNNAGVVLWQDATGASVDGSALCCQEQGGGQWIWDETDKTCYTQVVTDNGDDEGGVDESGGSDDSGSGSGGGGSHGVANDFPKQLFLPDFNPDAIKTLYNKQNKRKAEVHFELQATTSGTLPVIAEANTGAKRLTLLSDMILPMTVEFVAKVLTTGSDYGKMLYGKSSATVRVKDNVPAKPDTDQIIFDNGDIPTASVTVFALLSNNKPTLSFSCAGTTGIDLEFTINVVAMPEDNLERTSVTAPVMSFQNGKAQAFMNDDIVQFNNVIA